MFLERTEGVLITGKNKKARQKGGPNPKVAKPNPPPAVAPPVVAQAPPVAAAAVDQVSAGVAAGQVPVSAAPTGGPTQPIHTPPLIPAPNPPNQTHHI